MSEQTRDRERGTRCPYCHDSVNGDWVACAGCLARHHAGCWTELGRCGACASAVPLEREKALVARVVAPPPEPVSAWQWALLALALVFAGVLAGVMLAPRAAPPPVPAPVAVAPPPPPVVASRAPEVEAKPAAFTLAVEPKLLLLGTPRAAIAVPAAPLDGPDLPRGEGAVLAIVATPDGEHLVTAHPSAKLVLWDASGTEVLERVSFWPQLEEVTGLRFESGCLVLVGRRGDGKGGVEVPFRVRELPVTSSVRIGRLLLRDAQRLLRLEDPPTRARLEEAARGLEAADPRALAVVRASRARATIPLVARAVLRAEDPAAQATLADVLGLLSGHPARSEVERTAWSSWWETWGSRAPATDVARFSKDEVSVVAQSLVALVQAQMKRRADTASAHDPEGVALIFRTAMGPARLAETEATIAASELTPEVVSAIRDGGHDRLAAARLLAVAHRRKVGTIAPAVMDLEVRLVSAIALWEAGAPLPVAELVKLLEAHDPKRSEADGLRYGTDVPITLVALIGHHPDRDQALGALLRRGARYLGRDEGVTIRKVLEEVPAVSLEEALRALEREGLADEGVRRVVAWVRDARRSTR